MDRERLVQLFFFAFLGLMGYELYLLLYPFVVPILWAMLLAFIAHPAQLELKRLLKSRSLAALLVTTGVALGVVLPSVWLSSRLAEEAQALYPQVAALVKGGALDSKLSAWLLHSKLAAALAAALERRGIQLGDQLSRFTLQVARLTTNYFVTNLADVARNLVTIVLDFAISLFAFFYLLRDGQSYYDAVVYLTPLYEQDKIVVFETLRDTLSSVMRGIMLCALLDGVFIGFGFLVSGIPYWVFLAVLAAVGGVLPVGGTMLVWLPACAYLVYTGSFGYAVFLAIWCLASVTVIDTFVKPAAMRHGTGLPTVLLFFGVLGGLQAYGPIGIFAGPAIIAVFAALLRVYQRTYGEPGEAG